MEEEPSMQVTLGPGRSVLSRGVLVLAIMIFATACTTTTGQSPSPDASVPEDDTSEPASAAATSTPAPVTADLRFGFPSEPDLRDTVLLLAFERLNERGWSIEPVFFAQPETEIAALVQGDIELGTGASPAPLAAIQGDSDLRIVAATTNGTAAWFMVGTADMETCDDLVGQPFALHSAGGSTTAYANFWVDQNCSPEAQDQIEPFFIAGAENRAAAMLRGEVAATLLEREHIEFLESESPGAFKVLGAFGDEPEIADLNTDVITANGAFLAENQAVVVELLAELARAYADAEDDPEILRAVAEEYQLWDESSPDTIRELYESGVFDPELTMTEDSLVATLAFLEEYQGLSPGLTVDQVADLEPLQLALEQVGQ
jgi:NitT/TauT family transport system substrate-binding protein